MEQTRGNPPETAASGASGSKEGGGRFGRTKEFVGEKYSAAADAVKDRYSAVKDKVGEVDFNSMTEQVRQYVRANPGKALLISVGVGFLIGILLRRGGDEED